MKNWALGWACNLNDIFIRFPYEKYKSLMTKLHTKIERKNLVKRIFREGVRLVIEDIVVNNVTFKAPTLFHLGGEIHMEPIRGSQFEEARKHGKFTDVDFLESVFTGFLMYLYVHGKRDNFLARRKFPIYMSKFYKDIITKNTNEGKLYG